MEGCIFQRFPNAEAAKANSAKEAKEAKAVAAAKEAERSDLGLSYHLQHLLCHIHE
jgi:hypothetical protein